jgi:hypothetical protein
MADEDWVQTASPRRSPHGSRNQATCCSRPTASGITRSWLCELRNDGEEYGVIALFYRNEALIIGRRFWRRKDPTRTPRELAIAWAEQERKAIQAYEPEPLAGMISQASLV